MKLQVVVSAIRSVALGVKEFTFIARDGAELPKWQPGAHIQVLLPLAGDPGRRAYSLIGDPEGRQTYRIAVQMEPDGLGGSRYLHHRVAEGDRMVIASPLNSFELAPATGRPVELVAGGVGITPLIAMVRVLARREDDFRITVFARDRARIPFVNQIESAFAERANIIVNDDTTENARHLQRVARDAANREGDIYICGPAGLVAAAIQAASNAGIPPERIRRERFVSPAANASGQPFRVRLARSNIVCEVPARRSALDTIEGVLGPILPYDCRAGYCGTCVQTVLEGEPEHRDTALGPREHEKGQMCICVSRAQGGEITLDL